MKMYIKKYALLILLAGGMLLLVSACGSYTPCVPREIWPTGAYFEPDELPIVHVYNREALESDIHYTFVAISFIATQEARLSAYLNDCRLPLFRTDPPPAPPLPLNGLWEALQSPPPSPTPSPEPTPRRRMGHVFGANLQLENGVNVLDIVAQYPSGAVTVLTVYIYANHAISLEQRIPPIVSRIAVEPYDVNQLLGKFIVELYSPGGDLVEISIYAYNNEPITFFHIDDMTVYFITDLLIAGAGMRPRGVPDRVRIQLENVWGRALSFSVGADWTRSSVAAELNTYIRSIGHSGGTSFISGWNTYVTYDDFVRVREQNRRFFNFE